MVPWIHGKKLLTATTTAPPKRNHAVAVIRTLNEVI
jgi:hypothetical protein